MPMTMPGSVDMKMIGRQFNRLRVIGFDGIDGKKRLWRCECKCGNEAVVTQARLRSGHTKSCGCLIGGPPKRDIAGQTFGRLTAIQRTNKKAGRAAVWFCVCSCGSNCNVSVNKLTSGHTRSCGCFRAECLPPSQKTHGLSKSSEYNIWKGMQDRCHNPESKDFRYWGRRGIRVCERWRESFETFYADMGPRPSPKHSIDRYPDNDGDYEPSNCRWATAKEQAQNRRPGGRRRRVSP